jgi:outer membrane protein OmpA-like peptidoglycan-associated protein
VHFAFDRCDLVAESRRAVTDIADALRRNPNLRVRIEGHADPRGTDAYNRGLSACRVCSVHSLLEELGVRPAQMEDDPRGESQLATRERSVRGYALDRRVEMVLMDETGRVVPAEPQERDLQIESRRRPGKVERRVPAPECPEYRRSRCASP